MKGREQQRKLVCGDPTTRVADLETHLGLLPLPTDGKGTALGHGVYGILYQVEQHTAKHMLQGHLAQIPEPFPPRE